VIGDSNGSFVRRFKLVDGSVRFIAETVDHQTFQHLGGRADGNTVREF